MLALGLREIAPVLWNNEAVSLARKIYNITPRWDNDGLRAISTCRCFPVLLGQHVFKSYPPRSILPSRIFEEQAEKPVMCNGTKSDMLYIVYLNASYFQMLNWMTASNSEKMIVSKNEIKLSMHCIFSIVHFLFIHHCFSEFLVEITT